LAVKNLIYILGRLGRFDESLEQVVELRRISSNQIAADIAEGRMRIAMGDAEAGLSLLARVPARGRDDDGMEYAAHMLAAIRGEALASLGEFGQAVDVVLEAVRSDGVLEADLGELARWLEQAHRSPKEIGDALDIDDLMPVLGRVLRQPPEVADVLLEGIWERFPERLEPLAAAGRLGPRLPVARALVWSSRLRQRGLAVACPLVAIANDEAKGPRTRILAAAAAFGSFGERAVVNAVHEARRLLDARSLEESTLEIGRLAPGLLEAEHVDLVVPPSSGPPVAAAPERGRRPPMAATLRAVAPVPRRGGINIVGPFESTSVEGAVARTLATELHRHGTAVSTMSYHADGRRGPLEWTHGDQGDHPFDTTLLVLTGDDLANYVIDHGAASFEGRYMIGVWLWDLERPAEVMTVAGRMVHEVWVPSAFTADAVARATSLRVQRVPIPVRVSTPAGRPAPKTPPMFVARVDYDTGFERQNPLGVVAAFSAAFAAGSGPRLVIRTAHADRYPAEHAALVDAVAAHPDVAIVHDVEGRAEDALRGWAAGSSCFVSLHRSEGTGLGLAQAMARGIPTIVTSHSFGSEMQDQRDSMQVPCELTPIPTSEYRCAPGGSWAEPDIDAAAKAMRLLVEQPKVAAARARRAQERARRQFSPSRSVRAMLDRVGVVDRSRYGDPDSRGAQRATA
jgi:tetratricopeptide (TPR) repeat protein